LLFLVLEGAGLARLGALRPVGRAIARSRSRLAVPLDALEEQLGKTGGPWLLGEGFTLADVRWLVILERLVQADWLSVFLGPGRRPSCRAYRRRLGARPSYRAAILGHAHPTIGYGTERLRRPEAADAALREANEGRGA